MFLGYSSLFNMQKLVVVFFLKFHIEISHFLLILISKIHLQVLRKQIKKKTFSVDLISKGKKRKENLFI